MLRLNNNYLYTILGGLLIISLTVSCSNCHNSRDDNQVNKLDLFIERDSLKGRSDLNFVILINNQNVREADLSKFKLKIIVEEPDNFVSYTDVQGAIHSKTFIDENLTYFTSQPLLQTTDKPLTLDFTIQPLSTAIQVNIKVLLYYIDAEQPIAEKLIVWQEAMPAYQVVIKGVDSSTILRSDEEFTFLIENQDTKNSAAVENILLAVESEVELELNGYVVNEQGVSLNTVLGVQEIDAAHNGKENFKKVKIKVKNTRGQSISTPVILVLRDKEGNKLGEEKRLIWEPKKIEPLLTFNLSKQDLQGTEACDRQIKFSVNQVDATVLDSDKIILQLIPKKNSIASILGATTTLVTHNRAVYIYQIKKEDIGKEITALSINPQGSKKASFKVQLLYNGNPQDSIQKLTWQAGVELNFRLEGLEEKDRHILSGIQALNGTDMLQIVIKNLGRAVQQECEALLYIEEKDAQKGNILFEIHYNDTHEIENSVSSIKLSNQKIVAIDLYHLMRSNNFTQKEGSIKIGLQSVNPKLSQQAILALQIKDAKSHSNITAPIAIYWQAAMSSATQEVTDEMLATVKTAPLCAKLYKVLKIIRKGKSISTTDINKVDKRHPYGYTALQEAICLGRLDIVALLLDKGADINMSNKRGQAPIELAVSRFDVEMVRVLLKQPGIRSKIAVYNGGEKLLLNLAIERANRVDRDKFTELTDLLLAQLNTPDVLNKQDSITKQTPLLLAIHYNQPELAKKLLDKGANPSLKDNQGRSALFFAVYHHQKELAEQLIAKHDQLYIRDDKGNTPLHMAVALPRSKEIAKLLINEFKDAGISIDIPGQKGVTPLHKAAAAEGDNVDIVTALLEAGAQPGVVDENHQIPLHYAAQNNNIKVVKSLIAYKPALVNFQDKYGKTPLHVAVAQNYNASNNIKNSLTQTINFLIDKGARLDIQDNQVYTPLHLLVARNYIDIVQNILQNSNHAITNTIKSNDGNIPSDLATTDLMKELLQQ